jgi:hypothetical protein
MACQLKGKICRVHDVEDIDEKAKYKIYEAQLTDDCDLVVGEIMFSVCDSGFVEVIIKDIKDIRAERGADPDGCDCEECTEALDEDGNPIMDVVPAKGSKKGKNEIKISDLVDSNHEIA